MDTRPPIGWPFLPLPNATGSLVHPSSLDESVRDAIKLILTVNPGELLMHPEFGAGLERYLEQPNSIALRRDIHDTITDSLTRWESRILLDRVDVDEDADDPALVRVQIAYRLRRTGSPNTLGLTLETGA
jgi:phage baseplate assembly protein W